MIEYSRNEITRGIIEVPGTDHKIPVTVVSGSREGRKVLLSAGVHCREYVGTETLIRLSRELEPETIAGTVFIVPTCNSTGFFAHTNDRFPEDGKNLNHLLPGNPQGSPGERVADTVCREILSSAEYVIDLHSGGSYEDLVPHAYISKVSDPETMKAAAELSSYADMPYVVGMTSKDGLVSYSAMQGKPCVLIERGHYSIWSEEEVLKALCDVKNMLRFLGVLCDGKAPVRHFQEILWNAVYDSAPVSGCYYPAKKPGDHILKGEYLGRIGDFFGNTLAEIYAKEDGVILYQTASLALTKGEDMVAYGVMSPLSSGRSAQITP